MKEKKSETLAAFDRALVGEVAGTSHVMVDLADEEEDEGGAFNPPKAKRHCTSEAIAEPAETRLVPPSSSTVARPSIPRQPRSVEAIQSLSSIHRPRDELECPGRMEDWMLFDDSVGHNFGSSAVQYEWHSSVARSHLVLWNVPVNATLNGSFDVDKLDKQVFSVENPVVACGKRSGDSRRRWCDEHVTLSRKLCHHPNDMADWHGGGGSTSHAGDGAGCLARDLGMRHRAERRQPTMILSLY